MAYKPGSRPRGSLGRPFERTVNLSVVEHVLIKRWADRRGLAIGAALRELAVTALAAEAPDDPAYDAAALERAAKYMTTGT